MGVIIPEGYGTAAIHWKLDGVLDDLVCTFAYRWAVGFGANRPFDPALHAQEIATLLTSPSNLCAATSMSTVYTFKELVVTEVNSTGPVVANHTVNMVGTSPNAVPPMNCCLLVRKFTAHGGRMGRGRMFLPMLSIGEDLVTPAGVVNPGMLNTKQTQCNNLLAGMNTLNMPMNLLHSDPTVGPDIVTSLQLQYTLATQRRRMR